MTRFLSRALLIAILSSSAVQAQQWAKDMFKETSHDFGTVARGAKVEYAFPFENIYEEEAHISAVRSTCGCTSTKVSQDLLKTWEKAEVNAVVDTAAYLGQKDSTLTVVFDKPFPGEVQLHIHCYIRSDVVVHPGVVQFGSVPHGIDQRKKVTISYAGRGDWAIKEVEAPNAYLKPLLVETSRSAGQVNYELIVDLDKQAPVGYLRDHLMLVTNDPNQKTSRIPVSVEGIVAPAVSVRPSPLMLGVVKSGQSVTRPLIVQATGPFHIVGAKCEDDRFKCKVPSEAKSIQIVPITFSAAQANGKVSETIHLETDQQGGEKIDVAVHVQVVP